MNDCMILKIIGSSSKGNCYVIGNDTECLILDAGIQYKEVIKAIDYDTKRIKAVLITHSHSDHSKYTDQYRKLRFPVIEGFLEGQDKPIKVCGFSIQPFALVHDVPCVGYYIFHKKMGSLVYLTDTEYCKYTFPGINHILVEANYDDRIILPDHPAYKHIMQGHMSFSTSKAFVEANKTCNLRTVVLCHLSAENADPVFFSDDLKSSIGSSVYVGIAGYGTSEVELKRFPF